jgi:hypothetical protein
MSVRPYLCHQKKDMGKAPVDRYELSPVHINFGTETQQTQDTPKNGYANIR